MDINFENNLNIEKDLNIEGELTTSSNKIHIRYQQRNKRKGITIIEGLELDNEEKKKFIKKFKKEFCCSGCEKKNENGEDIFQFQGDHRENIKIIIQNNYNIDPINIIIHGI
jgi:translation initiation factor SUI1